MLFGGEKKIVKASIELNCPLYPCCYPASSCYYHLFFALPWLLLRCFFSYSMLLCRISLVGLLIITFLYLFILCFFLYFAWLSRSRKKNAELLVLLRIMSIAMQKLPLVSLVNRLGFGCLPSKWGWLGYLIQFKIIYTLRTITHTSILVAVIFFFLWCYLFWYLSS